MASSIDRSRISVKFRRFDWPTMLDAIEACGGEYGGRNVPQIRVVTVVAKEGEDIEALRLRLIEHPQVEWAGYPIIPERRATYHADAPGAYLDLTWQLKRMNVFHAWKQLGNRGNPAIRIAVADTGIAAHVGLKTPDWAYQSASGEVGVASDYGYFSYPLAYGYWYSHGTNCWSCIMAIPGPTGATSGVCPDAYGIMVGMSNEDDSWPNVAGAIVAAADAGAMILSASWGWRANVDPDDTANVNDAYSRDVIDAFNYAQERGCLIFAAAGNYNEFYSGPAQTANPVYNYIPNDMEGCINVGGVLGVPGSAYDQPGTNTAWGPGIDFASPGGDIFMCNCNTQTQAGPLYGWGGYNTYTGSNFDLIPNIAANGFTPGPVRNGHVSTSFATPLAAGVAALIWSANPGLTGPEVVQIMRDTASRGRHVGYDPIFPLAGIPNAGKGVAKARSTAAANAGIPIPYLGVEGPGALVTVSGGVATTALDGSVYLDAGGFVDGADVALVEVFHGSRRVYFGPPALLPCTATAGATPLRVRSITPTGAVADESYSDLAAGSVSLVSSAGFTVQSEIVSGSSVRLYGLRGPGTTITVT